MSAKFTNHIREFIASSFLSSIQTTRPADWLPNTVYHAGSQVVSGGKVYVASVGGISGTTSSPAGIPTDIDNDITWTYVGPETSGNLFEGNVFLTIGKPADWSVSSQPDEVNAIDSYETESLNNIITAKKIRPADIKISTVRTDWVSGNTYDAYSDELEFESYTRPFFVVTDEMKIYKCLDNNGSVVSINKPIEVSVEPFRTADGYVWKFMGNIPTSDAVVFMTKDFMPVSVKQSSTEDPVQWAVQQYAKSGSIGAWKIVGKTGEFVEIPEVVIYGDGSGASAEAYKNGSVLSQVYVTAAGQDYSKASTYAFVTNGVVSGSGATASATVDPVTGAITDFTINNAGSLYTSGATVIVVGTAKKDAEGEVLPITHATEVQAVLAGGSITDITFTDGGANYESVDVYVVPGTAGAVAVPVMAPASGHGHNIVRELGASTALISVRLTNTNTSDQGYFLIGPASEFHQICLVTDLYEKKVGAEPLRLANGSLYVGPQHPGFTTGTIDHDNDPLTDDINLHRVEPGTGVVLYINNTTTVTRSTDQEEDIKIAITL